MDSVIEYVTVPFMGFDVLAIALDGIPVKNHLPAPLAAAACPALPRLRPMVSREEGVFNIPMGGGFLD